MGDSNDPNFVLTGVMGWPVAHSRSPTIHNHWIAQHQLKGTYALLPVQPEHLHDAIKGLVALGFAGCNVTIPHKVNAMKMMDIVHPTAKRSGAINTIVVQKDGALHGFNNDGYGYIQSLKDVNPHWKADAGPILILGAGGASRAIALSLLEQGAKEIRLVNRTKEKAQELAQEFSAFGLGQVNVLDWQDRNDAMQGVSLLINTTNQGMHDQADLDIDIALLSDEAMVSDAIYIPLETPLLKSARLKGHLTVNGLGMLLNQARPAFKAWFGLMPEITPALRQAIQATF